MHSLPPCVRLVAACREVQWRLSWGLGSCSLTAPAVLQVIPGKCLSSEGSWVCWSSFKNASKPSSYPEPRAWCKHAECHAQPDRVCQTLIAPLHDALPGIPSKRKRTCIYILIPCIVGAGLLEAVLHILLQVLGRHLTLLLAVLCLQQHSAGDSYMTDHSPMQAVDA